MLPVGMGFNDLLGWPAGVQLGRIWDIGAHWGAIHSASDTFDWTKLDSVVEKMEAAGQEITYVIGATPQWLAAAVEPGYASWLGPGSNSIPASIDEFNKFVWQVGTRYKSRIKYYELWNEPQNQQFMWPHDAATFNALANMTRRAKHTLHAVDSDATLLSASMLPRKSSGGMKKARRYLEGLSAFGFPVDALNLHIYPEIGQNASKWDAYLTDALENIRAFPGMPATLSKPSNIWVTESNYGLDPAGKTVIPEADARPLVCETYAIMRRTGVQKLAWYTWERTASIGGLNLVPGSTAWAAIEECAAAPMRV